MKDIVEQFGLGFLQIVGSAFLVALFMSFFRTDGILNEIVKMYMYSICG